MKNNQKLLHTKLIICDYCIRISHNILALFLDILSRGSHNEIY